MTIPIIKNKNYQPFVKWVGGKRGLLSQIIPLLPKKFNNYFEPFVGGGALFFELKNLGLLENKEIFLFDINSELINAYNVVKNYPEELLKELETFKQKHTKEFYYEIRAWDRENDFLQRSDIQRASRFIYLNKTCFNGLYRVNKQNQNNVPIGNYKEPNICDIQTILSASEALQNVNILNVSYKEVLKYASKDDLVYFDPPYYPLTQTASFTSYSEFEFLEKEQIELFEIFKNLSKKGCNILHSNSDTEFIKNLYKDFEIKEIFANRFINSKSDSRGKISEIIVKDKKQMEIYKNFYELSIEEKKEIFVKNLVPTNRGFDFYVDWKNADAFKEFEVELNSLNVLIGVEEEIFKDKFQNLLFKVPSVINAFPLLFALSKKEREELIKGKNSLKILENESLEENALEFNFIKKQNYSHNDIEKYYNFFTKLGLKNLFQNLLKKNVIDYVIGVLVGLDSNGRKNRGGQAFELACEPIIRNICKKYEIILYSQKQFKYLKDRYDLEINEDLASRKADFILIKDKIIMNIEANFYFDSGSKPEEIIDSYSNRNFELKRNNIKFIYLTDGIKCWGNTDKNQLNKGFRTIDYIINYHMLKKSYFEDIIKKEFDIN
ncbi:Dam family site-specific DNA-(adenine-N6)-methyltransferase [Aliarcobacter thereius]|uniref:DpnII family type II restriction endonuclease n=1 Tax=Aliarcobacter thereius TaxID=544718 RepID=UPI0010FCFD4C|nr:DpnII family type II restriction endonuclease [Aliarcobacter thereius]TLT08516.1 Dam family site-specific DNA-(adenine-N6)-methyltransferase [Aliarcobacter thereius]